LWPNLLFLQNYVGPNPALHTWSLAVEEHFYLLLPFSMLALHRWKRLPLLTVLGLCSPLLFSAIRQIWVYYFSGRFQITGMETHMVLDGLLMGVGLRALKEYSPEIFAALGRWRWIAVALGGVLLAFGREVPYVSMAPVGSTLLLLGTLHLTPADFGGVRRIGRPIVRLMGWVGMYSYSIYLWHPTFTGFAEKNFISHLHLDTTRSFDWFVNRTLIVIAIILGGWFVSRLVEWPVLRLRDRYFPSRA
jgi:peptidoglycan/LPS O-acetylase OafA/YrhL